MGKLVVEHIHNGILLSHKKEHIWVGANEVELKDVYSLEGKLWPT